MPAGQAQKETFVNEALSRIDGLLHAAVTAEQNAPPTTPADGGAWLIGPSPTGAWAGLAGSLALRQAGQWLIVAPRDGMRVLDNSTGQEVVRRAGAWVRASTPALPTGGTTVDAQARTAIAGIIASLRDAGILST
jgi:hypothetical protein